MPLVYTAPALLLVIALFLSGCSERVLFSEEPAPTEQTQ